MIQMIMIIKITNDIKGAAFMSKEYKPLPMIKSSRFIKLFDCCDENTRQDVIAQRK